MFLRSADKEYTDATELPSDQTILHELDILAATNASRNLVQKPALEKKCEDQKVNP